VSLYESSSSAIKCAGSTDVTKQGVSAKIKSSVVRKCSLKTHPNDDEDVYELMARPS
jgi:hypothetical protein